MPNWNDPEDIKKWLEKNKDKKVETVLKSAPFPTIGAKPKPAPAKAEKKNERPYGDFQSVPPTVEVKRRRPSGPSQEQPTPPGEVLWRTMQDNLERPPVHTQDRWTPYTNYQALPKFVESQRRNPAGGYAGIKEAQSYLPNQVGYNPPGPRPIEVGLGSESYTPWDQTAIAPNGSDTRYIPLQPPGPDPISTIQGYLQDAQGLGPFRPELPKEFSSDYYQPGQGAIDSWQGRNSDFITANAPWNTGRLTPVEFQYQSPEWRKTDDLWHRIRDADIVPAGQNVPLGQTMRPTSGPRPYVDPTYLPTLDVQWTMAPGFGYMPYD